MTFRTDRNNNPTAFTTNLAEQAGLELGIDYTAGEAFFDGTKTWNTAKLLRDPLQLTIKVIDTLTFYTQAQRIRWVYIAIPKFIWDNLKIRDKIAVIKFMYEHEGGIGLNYLFFEPLQ